MSDLNEALPQSPTRSSLPLFKQYYRHIVTAIILIACLVGLTGQFDRYTHRMVDESLMQAGVTYGTVKASSMLLSKLKGVELQLGPVHLRLGEVLEPINETLVYTSHIVMMSIASLGIQKVLLGIFSSSLGNALLILTSCFALATIWSPSFQRYKSAAKKTLITVVFVRFSLAIVVLANGLVNHLFLNEQVKYNEQQIEIFESQLDELPEALEEAHEHFEEDKGIWQRTKDKFGEMRSSVSSMTDGIADMPERFDHFVTNFMNIIALYLLKTILIPLAFLWGLKRLFDAVFSIDLNQWLTKQSS